MDRQLIDGIIQVTGPPGVGKTSFALASPVSSAKKIAVLNFDHKPYFDRNSFKDENGPFMFYRSYLHMLQERKKNTNDPTPELLMVEQVMRDVEKCEGAELVILDAWEVFAKGLVPFIVRKGTDYKDFPGGGQILRMSQYGYASVVETSILDTIYAVLKARTVFVINHLGNEYDGNSVRTGRRVPRSSERLHANARARFWLKPNPDPDYDCPIAFVMKDPGVRQWDQKNGGFRASRLLPYRLNPAVIDRPNDNVSLWDIIAHYQNEPVGERTQNELELPTAEEFAMISGTLTRDEQRVWDSNKNIALALGSQFSAELGAVIDDMKKQGAPFGLAFPKAKAAGYAGNLMEFKGIYEG